MESVIEIKGLTKKYGDKVVVNNVSFSIERGSVCGLLGPNGAGKTTIMKLIMNEIKSNGGSISYDNNLKIKSLQDVPNFYEFYTIKEYLKFILEIAKYSKNIDNRVTEIIEFLNLKSHEDIKISKLSRGLRQKLGIASVIIDEPDVLILDEPVSALDPIGRKEIFDIIQRLRGKCTIVFSSHILNDIERLCDHIVLINKGKIIVNDDIKNLTFDKNILSISFKSKEDLDNLKKELQDYEISYDVNIENCIEIQTEDIASLQEKVFSILSKDKIIINSMRINKDTLEDVFLREVRSHE